MELPRFALEIHAEGAFGLSAHCTARISHQCRAEVLLQWSTNLAVGAWEQSGYLLTWRPNVEL